MEETVDGGDEFVDLGVGDVCIAVSFGGADTASRQNRPGSVPPPNGEPPPRSSLLFRCP